MVPTPLLVTDKFPLAPVPARTVSEALKPVVTSTAPVALVASTVTFAPTFSRTYDAEPARLRVSAPPPGPMSAAFTVTVPVAEEDTVTPLAVRPFTWKPALPVRNSVSAPSRFAPATVTVAPEFEAPVATVVFAVPVVTANAFPLASASVVTDTVSVAAEALTSTPLATPVTVNAEEPTSKTSFEDCSAAFTVIVPVPLLVTFVLPNAPEPDVTVRLASASVARSTRPVESDASTSTPSPTLLTSNVDEPLRFSVSVLTKSVASTTTIPFVVAATVRSSTVMPLTWKPAPPLSDRVSLVAMFAAATVIVAPPFELPVPTVRFPEPAVTVRALPLTKLSVETPTASLVLLASTSTPWATFVTLKADDPTRTTSFDACCAALTVIVPVPSLVTLVFPVAPVPDVTVKVAFVSVSISTRPLVKDASTSTPDATLFTSKVEDPLRTISLALWFVASTVIVPVPLLITVWLPPAPVPSVTDSDASASVVAVTAPVALAAFSVAARLFTVKWPPPMTVTVSAASAASALIVIACVDEMLLLDAEPTLASASVTSIKPDAVLDRDALRLVTVKFEVPSSVSVLSAAAFTAFTVTASPPAVIPKLVTVVASVPAVMVRPVEPSVVTVSESVTAEASTSVANLDKVKSAEPFRVKLVD